MKSTLKQSRSGSLALALLLGLSAAALRERKAAQALQQWENEIRNRAYIEMRAEPR